MITSKHFDSIFMMLTLKRYYKITKRSTGSKRNNLHQKPKAFGLLHILKTKAIITLESVRKKAKKQRSLNPTKIWGNIIGAPKTSIKMNYAVVRVPKFL